MKIGFARQSTTHQKFGLENQVELLTNEGCEKIFCEETSGASAKRPEFEKAIEFAREGDIFVVTTLSRFGRSLKNILDHVAQLESKKVAFKILDLNIDTSTKGTGRTVNLYQSYKDQFSSPVVSSPGASGIPYFKSASDLEYYVTAYDTSVLSNLSINSNGVLTYDVIGSATPCSFINVVLVVK